ncbi:MAG TPA: SH3 domain-containing protein [Candidatus Acidoferrum sp.]|nr:SH3 domain-containing protein [Candidatus Acidoferrum sp.]
MLRNRLLITLGGCAVLASAAWADGVAYVDCTSHSEDTQVFGKPRRSPDVVASLPCGERFTVIQNGFIFSRIQTKDGKIGYVYSNVISQDPGGKIGPRAAEQAPAVAAKPPVTPALPPAATPAPVTPAAQPAATIAPASTSAPVQPTVQASSSQAQAAPEAAKPAPAKPPVATSILPTPPTTLEAAAEKALEAAQQGNKTENAPATVAPAEVSPAAPAAAPVPSATSASTPAAASAANVPESSAAPAQPEAAPAASAQPEAAAAQPEPAPAPIRATPRESWERPNPGGIRRTPLIELFGGYSFARVDNGSGSFSNLNGALGSFGWNAKPWLQVVADSSYNLVTIGGVKNVLYGNHWGARIFGRSRNRWGLTPFVEGLAGGSRADAKVSGAGGYSTSANCFSFKAGGGLDLRPSKHWELRLLNVDYYRTAFGTGLHQNNYTASVGIVLRLFGGAE